MAIYEFKCPVCHRVHEMNRPIGSTLEPPWCCGAEMKRVWNAPGIVFKGSGWACKESDGIGREIKQDQERDIKKGMVDYGIPSEAADKAIAEGEATYESKTKPDDVIKAAKINDDRTAAHDAPSRPTAATT